MDKIKIFKTIIILLFAIQITAIASFEMNINANFGLASSIPSIETSNNKKDSVYNTIKSGISADLKCLFQIGNYFWINKGAIKGASLLTDIGYAFNGLATEYKDTERYYEVIYFQSVNIGIISKLNFSKWSIGLGGGVTVPIISLGYSKKYGGPLAYPDYNLWTFYDIKNIYQTPVIPYIKLTVEGYLYLYYGIALMGGVYVQYNFDMKYNTDFINNHLSQTDPIFRKYNISSISFGIYIGSSFGRHS